MSAKRSAPTFTVRTAPKIPALLVALLLVPVPVLAVLAAWPIYETGELWLVAGVGAVLAYVVTWLGTRLRWGAFTLLALALAFAVAVVPLAVPSALTGGPREWLRALVDGLAAVALGWKQLLTLTLPLGTYQTVLVPFLLTVFVSVAGAAALALRGGKGVPAAALAFVLPVLFGTVFGSSAVSAPLTGNGIRITAPRELGLWLAAVVAAVAWVAWASGRDRRAALRRGREADAALVRDTSDAGPAAPRTSGRGAVRRNRIARTMVAAATVIAAVAGALVLAPLATQGPRTVPRDAIDPELVVRDRVSPLAAYRTWKRDDALREPVFSVTSEDGRLPERLRLAVLTGYDGVDFTPGEPGEAGRFARFPSGSSIPDPVRVSVSIEPGYADVWVPIAAPLAAPPRFHGPRGGELTDSFYLNRENGSAVAVPTAKGLRSGDAYTATMSAAPSPQLDPAPASEESLIALETMPELAQWIELQELPRTGQGVAEAIERLRTRGYLSHSLTDGAGENAWLQALAAESPIRFFSSPGGHSESRIEDLFAQLTEQELAAGDNPTDAMLVAGIGDDEQFAAAAALIARAMGFESRVVVGVRIGGTDDGVPGVPACAETCTGEHLAAWVELAGADGVWAPLDVSPQVDTPPTMLQKGEQLPEFPTQPEERDANESDPPVGMSTQESADPSEADEGGLSALWPILRVIGLSLLGLALLALLIVFVPAVKRLRSRRRRALRSPELRALAAWDELLDTYRDTGAHIPVTGRSEIMRLLNVEGGDWIAWTVDQAVYAKEGITEDTANMLWEIIDARRAERWDDRTQRQRLRARYSFASFGVLTETRERGARFRRKQRGTPQ